jgi:hypothetical protein
VRFKQLEIEVKNRLKVEPFASVAPIIPAISHTLDNE